jgi:hypothetical protein
VTEFYAQVPDAQMVLREGGWVHNCSTTLPDLHLQVGDSTAGGAATLRLPGAVLTRGHSAVPGSPWCYGGVQVGRLGLTILGDIFLKAFFVVFDASDPPLGPRIGFAPQAPAVVNAQNVAAPSGNAQGVIS